MHVQPGVLSIALRKAIAKVSIPQAFALKWVAIKAGKANNILQSSVRFESDL